MSMRIIPMLDQRVQPFSNLFPSAATGRVGSGGSGGLPNVTVTQIAAGLDGFQGQPYRRLTFAAAATGTPGTDLISFDPSNFGISTLGMSVPTQVGLPYSFAIPVRCTFAQRVRPQAQGITATSGGTVKTGSDVTIIPNVWNILPLEAWIGLTPTVGLRLDVDLGSSALEWPAGAIFEVGLPFLYQRDTLPEVLQNGSSPGWRWLGTPFASESVGYPYTLESISGQPTVANTTIGTIGAPAQPNGQPLTIISLFENKLPGTIGAWANIVNNGGAVLSRSASSPDLFARFSFAPNSTLDRAFVVPNFLATPGLKTVGFSSSGDSARMSLVAGDASQSYVPPNVVSREGTTFGVNNYNNADFRAIHTLLFYREFNHATMYQLCAWLARKHGSPIPAGY